MFSLSLLYAVFVALLLSIFLFISFYFLQIFFPSSFLSFDHLFCISLLCFFVAFVLGLLLLIFLFVCFISSVFFFVTSFRSSVLFGISFYLICDSHFFVMFFFLFHSYSPLRFIFWRLLCYVLNFLFFLRGFVPSALF